MIRFVVNDIEIKLPDDFSIPLKFKNPMFHETGSHSLNGNLPNIPSVAKAFGFPYKIERKDQLAESFDFFVEEEEERFMYGTLRIKSVTEKYITIYLLIDKGSFNYAVGDTKLNEIDTGGIRDIGVDYLAAKDYYKTVAEGSQVDFDFAIFPIWNSSLFDDYTPLENRWKNYRDVVNNWQEHSIYGWGFHIENFGFTPFPYLGFTIDKLFKHIGYSVNKNPFVTDDDFKELCIYNIFTQIEKLWDGIGFVYDAKNDIDLSNNLPRVRIKDFLTGIRRYLAVEFFINNDNNSVEWLHWNDILDSTEYEDISHITNPKLIISEEVISGITLSAQNDGADSYYSENVLSLKELNEQDSVYTYASLPTTGNEPNDYRLVENTNKIYIWLADPYDTPDRWIDYSYYLHNYVDGDGSYPIDSSVDTLLMNRMEHTWMASPPKTWLIPVTAQKGNCDAVYNYNNNPATVRLLFYRGMFEDLAGDEYPLGTSSIYEYSAAKIATANLDLNANGEYGRHEKLFKKHDYWLKNIKREAKSDTKWTASHIKNLKWYRKQRIDGNNYLVSEIDARFTNKGIVPEKTILFKC